VRRSATKSLGALWKLPEVSRLGSDEGKVRRKAARELGELGDPRAVAPLIAALKDQSKNIIGQYYVQEASAEALKIIGTSEALAALDTDNDEGGIK
jgi:HEAT repeat protein